VPVSRLKSKEVIRHDALAQKLVEGLLQIRLLPNRESTRGGLDFVHRTWREVPLETLERITGRLRDSFGFLPGLRVEQASAFPHTLIADKARVTRQDVGNLARGPMTELASTRGHHD
jgi:hypothetical protein